MKKKILVFLTILVVFVLIVFGISIVKKSNCQKQANKILNDSFMKMYGFNSKSAFLHFKKGDKLILKANRIRRKKDGSNGFYQLPKEEKRIIWKSAKIEFDKAIELEPENLKLNKQYAELLSNLEKYTDSLKYFKKSLKLGMKEIEYFRKTFGIYEKLKNNKLMERDFQCYKELVRKSDDQYHIEYVLFHLTIRKEYDDVRFFLKKAQKFPELWNSQIIKSIKKELAQVDPKGKD